MAKNFIIVLATILAVATASLEFQLDDSNSNNEDLREVRADYESEYRDSADIDVEADDVTDDEEGDQMDASQEKEDEDDDDFNDDTNINDEEKDYSDDSDFNESSDY